MKRDTADGKINWLLVRPGPMLRRWAELLTRGSNKYERERQPGELRNWQRAEGVAEYERFLESAERHFAQYIENALRRLRGEEIEPDGYDEETGQPVFEDHGAAVFFNINGAEYVWERVKAARAQTFLTDLKTELDVIRRDHAEERTARVTDEAYPLGTLIKRTCPWAGVCGTHCDPGDCGCGRG